jgi:hypothetical protein
LVEELIEKIDREDEGIAQVLDQAPIRVQADINDIYALVE